MTKEECLNFIAYLKDLGEKISIESRSEMHRTFFNRYVKDPYRQAAKEVREMCLSSASPLQVYESLAMPRAKQNPNWKLIPGFGAVYEEDVADYLRDCGYGDADAAAIARAASLRQFNPAAYRDDSRMPEEFRVWGKGCQVPLETREWVTRLFPAEYIAFLHRNQITSETDFSVTEVSTKGTYNFYRYETARTNVSGRSHMVINFESKNVMTAQEVQEVFHGDAPRITVGLHSLQTEIAREKMIALAKLICRSTGVPEVWLNDLDGGETVTVIKALAPTRAAEEAPSPAAENAASAENPKN